MTTDTPESLLDAVGVDWREKYGTISCPECGWGRKANKPDISLNHASNCRRPSTRAVQPTYTGPALGTPELDAVLWVEGQRWLASFAEVNNKCWDVLFRVRKNAPKQYDITNDIAAVYLVAICPLPGHALAEAIKEVAEHG